MEQQEFNVQTSNWETYENFIVRLRNLLGRGQRYSHQRPILPTEDTGTIQWFDIVLRTNTGAITVRIRLSNLYLEGYRGGNPAQWYELGNSNLIPNSNPLGYDGSYTALARAADQGLSQITLGQHSLITAVNQLATGTTRENTAWSLIVVIQMFCESTRFTTISDHLTTTFSSGSRIPSWMIDLVHSWQFLSAALLRADANPNQTFLIPANSIRLPPDSREIRRVVEAANVLGIVLPGHCGGASSARFPRDAVINGQCRLARPLVEVFSVRINNMNGDNPGQLYGTIIVTDALDFQYIYNRTKQNPETIKEGDNATLTGPARSISAYGSFTIKVLLTDKDWWSPDDEISNGEISWNVFDTTNVYDKPLSGNIHGEDGSVTVNYIVLSDAVAASVKVELINGDNENPANVYGQLTATNGNFGDSKIVLFQQSSQFRIDLSPGQLIPLSRSIVAVPLNSSLVVTAELYDHDVISSDDEIANGTAEFPAQLSGTSEKSIFGKDGEIRVNVTWIFDI